ncbi:hypothetical protein M2459_002260 [Parabacteroides sp. PF5-5]|uniref:hypothetical protein n=1 Tax=unclassified Parabacteroides TaxID=2649774 RepID=UPI002474A48B|nr:MULTISPECIES: hypothetical protein [unclassified Parabacteroides]MDH6305163.1 hypothetical protein [Parabacteroides sp. PH5-39]MDH6316513.1 hypothetical protein [Parabacteroides sp. PF5-13]MDH6320023.1 hypothetical protein [Parabacteroides sp. PH5-13]MDH6323744.1 hypothetical protein [Parabacteroides sp. PH5-8]MDH6327700.1 hypothetical protein [Parabacteroides sp. PH5-41]
MEAKHLFSEDSDWLCITELTYPQGEIIKENGGLSIRILPDQIVRESWFYDEEGKFESQLVINQISSWQYTYESPDIKQMGTQKGTIHVDRNRTYSKFTIGDTLLNGYEITARNNNVCYMDGALYYDQKLIKAWSTVMTKQ